MGAISAKMVLLKLKVISEITEKANSSSETSSDLFGNKISYQNFQN